MCRSCVIFANSLGLKGASAGDVNHTTSFTYDNRGRLLSTTHPVDPTDGLRHTAWINYNPNDTVTSRVDELGSGLTDANHITTFSYDDYGRLRSTTAPPRVNGGTANVTTTIYYDTSGIGDNYTHTDSHATHLKSPSGNVVTTTVYDPNFWKTSVTVGDGTSDAATTVFTYDKIGNLASVQSPEEQKGHFPSLTRYGYDSRDRLQQVTDALGSSLGDPNHTTTYAYDAASRKTSMTRPNGQMINYNIYDNMNRLLKITVQETPDPDAITKYTYYTSGLLKDFQDPLISSSANKYTYVYDLMGRKTSLAYPPATAGATPRVESWHYDTVGRPDKFTNRNGKNQNLHVDALNRVHDFTWDDTPQTPGVTYGYDAASRTTSVGNLNASISRSYYNDNMLKAETTTYPPDSTLRTITYIYDLDGNVQRLQYPATFDFDYTYSHRNQLSTIKPHSGSTAIASYAYDFDGNLTSRSPDNGASSTFGYDELDRVMSISHNFSGGNIRTFRYGYDYVGNRMFAQRESGNGDVFRYDNNDQANGFILDTPLPTGISTPTPPPKNIDYDANGNRVTFSSDSYGAINNLNQYTSRNGSSSSVYDVNGNLTTLGWDATCAYTYDAQNRVLSAAKSGKTYYFAYDGLNRQVRRKIDTGAPVYNVYEGWSLIGEYASGTTTASNAYLYGAGGLVKNLAGANIYYYYQDGSGSTSHVANGSGALQERGTSMPCMVPLRRTADPQILQQVLLQSFGIFSQGSNGTTKLLFMICATGFTHRIWEGSWSRTRLDLTATPLIFTAIAGMVP